MNSLRQKITFGYYVLATLIVGLSVFAFFELRLIGDKIVAGGYIAEFFDTTLEIRRFEKNIFLYQQAEDLAENRAFIQQAQALLRDHRPAFVSFAGPRQTDALVDSLRRYATLMEAYTASGTAQPDGLENEIRQLGKTIVTAAEVVARAERASLQTSLDRHRQVLAVSIVLLAMVAVGIGLLVSRRVARPLQRLEEDMAAVASGKLTRLELASADREIASLTQAFNKVMRELELRQQQLLRAEKLASLGTLLSGVAHELNNPLSNISSSCQILLEEGETADPALRDELLEEIDAQTLRARNIVRSLLDFARDREIRREVLPLAPLIAETLRFVKGQVPSQVAVALDIPAEVRVVGDRQRLQQVFLNLIGNALEAVDGTGHVSLTARQHPVGQGVPAGRNLLAFGRCTHTGEVVDIEVRDDGHGIPADQLPRIFDPFFTTKDVGKGSGLGLFIAFEIVEEHGGCVAVESEPGKGTVFHIRLPIQNSLPLEGGGPGRG
ncbi:MAG: HAMP domain-containing sensor histidine kinase [Thiobacillus sp.]|nr:HAMP domain-containing sensor histidine kinase [Thiobacillus sp.]